MIKLGFYGCGNMGSVILENVLKYEICQKEEVIILDRSPIQLTEKAEKYGVKTTFDPKDLIDCTYVLLCIKPQNLKEIPPFVGANQVLISILAGTTIDVLKSSFLNTKIVRTMPNIPLIYDSGVTGIHFPGEFYFTVSEIPFVISLFSGGGKVIELKEEVEIDDFTVLCGSGPAFYLYMAESLWNITKKRGFTEDQCRDMTIQTLLGTVEMIKNSGESINELRKKITSPGGVTEAAIASIDPLFMKKAFDAGVSRAKEL